MAKKTRNPIDFNVANPPKAVTDPERAEADERGEPRPDPNYPKHLVLPDLDGPGGPASRELVVAQDAGDEKRYRAQGYMTHHEADIVERKAKDAPAKKAAKPVAAKKPANRKPKAPAAPIS